MYLLKLEGKSNSEILQIANNNIKEECNYYEHLGAGRSEELHMIRMRRRLEAVNN